jgi:hypothetical protein
MQATRHKEGEIHIDAEGDRVKGQNACGCKEPLTDRRCMEMHIKGEAQVRLHKYGISDRYSETIKVRTIGECIWCMMYKPTLRTSRS